MGLIDKFLPKEDRFAALMLYGMVFCTMFNGKHGKAINHKCWKDSSLILLPCARL